MKIMSHKRSFLRLTPSSTDVPGQEGYRLVSKLISKTKYQKLTNVMSFNTKIL
jgi:hypothetical protein